MTSRQRWLSVLNGRQPDRVPTDYWATGEFHERLKRDLGVSDDEQLWQRLHIDRPRFVGPRWAGTNRNDGADIWGITHQMVDYGSGAYCEATSHPLAPLTTVAQIHQYPWPDPGDFDASAIGDALAADDGSRIVQAGYYEPFLIYCAMRGMEQAYEDLLVNPEIADAILGHLFDYHYDLNCRIFQAGQGKIDMTYIAEDLGGQGSPLFSLELYRRFLMPRQKKMAELARRHNIKVFYHTDGAARVFLPDLIDQVGIDVLNPIQWRCPGMEREALVRDFGKHVVFHGAMDNQQTLPFGSVADVVREVKENHEIFHNARWICAPCHNIQPVTPTENIVAMFETIREIGAR